MTQTVDGKYCRDCGRGILSRAEICPHCGCRQRSPLLHFSRRNKWIAALLAFFLGSFGAHKFYLGQIGLGVIYLIFCCTFIPAIIAFVETFILLAMDEEKFQRKYCDS